MSTLTIVNTEQYTGKALSHFEDDAGNRLDNLHMLDGLVIVFADGDKIRITQDWRGNECYFSQRELDNAS